MGLEKIIKNEKHRTTVADITSGISSSLILGTSIDLLSGINTLKDWAYSRLFNSGAAAISSKKYGDIREYFFDKMNITEKSSFMKKYFVELLAFNTFPSLLYGPTVAVSKLASTFISEGYIDSNDLADAFTTMKDSYIGIVEASPIYSLLLPRWNDWVRKLFNVYTPVEKSTIHHAKEKLIEQEKLIEKGDSYTNQS